MSAVAGDDGDEEDDEDCDGWSSSEFESYEESESVGSGEKPDKMTAKRDDEYNVDHTLPPPPKQPPRGSRSSMSPDIQVLAHLG